MKGDLPTVATCLLTLGVLTVGSPSVVLAAPATGGDPADPAGTQPAGADPIPDADAGPTAPPDDAGAAATVSAGAGPNASGEGTPDSPELIGRGEERDRQQAAVDAAAQAEIDERQAVIDRKRRKSIPWVRRWRPERHMVTLGLYGGVFLANKDHDLYDPVTRPQEPLWAISPDVGLRLGYFPLRLLGVEAEFSANPTRVRSITNDFAFVFGFRAHAVLQLPFYSVTPFFLAGGGLMGVRSNILILGDDTDPAVHYGGGLKIFVNRWFGLRAEARNIISAAQTRQNSGTGHVQVLGGFTITFNRSKPRTLPDPLPVANPDRDNDGLLNEVDECPDAAGVEPHGCPDTDGDGFRDSEDECPEVPGIAPKGCPDKDTDGDGIMDSVDQCIYEKEIFNGIEDEDGCPDELPPELVKFEGALEGIEFAFGKDTIRTSSKPLLDKTVATLTEWPSIKIKITGHTDNVGKPASNLDLSKRRAASVKQYLVDAGIAADRIEAEGKGDTAPRADNATDDGRALNRRIEFEITDKGEKLIRRRPDGTTEVVGEAPPVSTTDADASKTDVSKADASKTDVSKTDVSKTDAKP